MALDPRLGAVLTALAVIVLLVGAALGIAYAVSPTLFGAQDAATAAATNRGAPTPQRNGGASTRRPRQPTGSAPGADEDADARYGDQWYCVLFRADPYEQYALRALETADTVCEGDDDWQPVFKFRAFSANANDQLLAVCAQNRPGGDVLLSSGFQTDCATTADAIREVREEEQATEAFGGDVGLAVTSGRSYFYATDGSTPNVRAPWSRIDERARANRFSSVFYTYAPSSFSDGALPEYMSAICVYNTARGAPGERSLIHVLPSADTACPARKCNDAETSFVFFAQVQELAAGGVATAPGATILVGDRVRLRAGDLYLDARDGAVQTGADGTTRTSLVCYSEHKVEARVVGAQAPAVPGTSDEWVVRSTNGSSRAGDVVATNAEIVLESVAFPGAILYTCNGGACGAADASGASTVVAADGAWIRGGAGVDGPDEYARSGASFDTLAACEAQFGAGACETFNTGVYTSRCVTDDVPAGHIFASNDGRDMPHAKQLCEAMYGKGNCEFVRQNPLLPGVDGYSRCNARSCDRSNRFVDDWFTSLNDCQNAVYAPTARYVRLRVDRGAPDNLPVQGQGTPTTYRVFTPSTSLDPTQAVRGFYHVGQIFVGSSDSDQNLAYKGGSASHVQVASASGRPVTVVNGQVKDMVQQYVGGRPEQQGKDAYTVFNSFPLIITVDLGAARNVSNVLLSNRADGAFLQRLAPTTVELLDEQRRMVASRDVLPSYGGISGATSQGFIAPQIGDHAAVTFTTPPRGQCLQVQQDATGWKVACKPQTFASLSACVGRMGSEANCVPVRKYRPPCRQGYFAVDTNQYLVTFPRTNVVRGVTADGTLTMSSTDALGRLNLVPESEQRHDERVRRAVAALEQDELVTSVERSTGPNFAKLLTVTAPRVDVVRNALLNNNVVDRETPLGSRDYQTVWTLAPIGATVTNAGASDRCVKKVPTDSDVKASTWRVELVGGAQDVSGAELRSGDTVRLYETLSNTLLGHCDPVGAEARIGTFFCDTAPAAQTRLVVERAEAETLALARSRVGASNVDSIAAGARLSGTVTLKKSAPSTIGSRLTGADVEQVEVRVGDERLVATGDQLITFAAMVAEQGLERVVDVEQLVTRDGVWTQPSGYDLYKETAGANGWRIYNRTLSEYVPPAVRSGSG